MGEKLVDEGKCRAIGVSNFSQKKVEGILGKCRIRPAVNQVEMHPYLPQQELFDYCKAESIVGTAYSPLGSPDSSQMPGMNHNGPNLLRDPVVSKIAESIGKTPAQVLLRWALQRGTIAIPKSVTKTRIAENAALFDWELLEPDYRALNEIKHRERFLKMEFGCGKGSWYKSPLEVWDDPEGL